MIELVFSISILMVIFLATLTFSILYKDYCNIQKVAREGAKEAIISRDVNYARNKALETAWLWGLDPGRTEVEFFGGSDDVTCTVHYIAKPFNKTFPKLLEGSPLQDYHLQTSARYRKSYSL